MQRVRNIAKVKSKAHGQMWLAAIENRMELLSERMVTCQSAFELAMLSEYYDEWYDLVEEKQDVENQIKDLEERHARNSR